MLDQNPSHGIEKYKNFVYFTLGQYPSQNVFFRKYEKVQLSTTFFVPLLKTLEKYLVTKPLLINENSRLNFS